jgi:hypothetical protein
MFGDGSANSAEPSKKLRMTKRTTYWMMEEQRQREGEDGGGQGDEVCRSVFNIAPLLNLLLEHTARAHISTVDPA